MPATVATNDLPLPPVGAETNRQLIRLVFALALPVLAEQVLNMMVGLTDTYLANHLPTHAADAGAAVGTIAYFMWFIGLLVSSVATGSTAIIARGKGARHRSLVNSVTGQSVSAAVIIGLVIGIMLYVIAGPLVTATQLQGAAPFLARRYLRLLSITLPFTLLMFIAGACMRGGGDTLTPAIIMVLVSITNMICSFALTRGWWGLPVMGFDGIALGTIIAYICGGVMQLLVLLSGRSAVILHWHRLRPHWDTIRRLVRIGLPAAVEGLLAWLANFAVIGVVNAMDASNISSAAHMNSVRLESISFLSGMAFASAAATMVGTSLGMKDPARARRAAYLSYLGGGGIMAICGLLMITLGRFPAHWLSGNNPQVIYLTTRCLFITGFIQSGFAASLVFGGALRGAGDTFVVMLLNLASIVGVRFTGVLIVGWLKLGLPAVWMVLCSELFLRGSLMYARFLQGKWKHIQV